jgi:hypothetical protein
MKTKEEIIQLAKEEYWMLTEQYERSAFVNGYTQCQEDMQKDVEYWQGEFDHWHKQAMEMADELKKLKEIRTIIWKL